MSTRVSVHRAALYCVLPLLALFTLRAFAATVPAGFTESQVATGLARPTTMQFAPDGRLFVLEQSGGVRVIENGALLPTPFMSLAVDATFERGLLGIAFDPDFAVTPWVYLYYTVPAGGGLAAHNRVIRVLAAGNVASGTPEVILDLEDLDDSVPGYHNGGAMAFAPDGTLFIGVGESMRPALSQDMTSRFGKMLRINRDGSIPPDNPFYATALGDNRMIWALGLRNPNNFAFNPTANGPSLLINDVGQTRWEEVNAGIAGANYGWPTAEGPDESGSPNPNFVYPIYSYFHSEGCAIVGGAFYAPATVTFPAAYHDQYFFADYCGEFTSPDTANSWIAAIDPAAPPPTQQNVRPSFADGLVAPVDVRVGPDGALYYLERPSGTAGSVYRIQYGSGGPGITAHPANVTVPPGQQASFTVTASGADLSYQWQRDQVDIPGATAATYAFTAQPADSGRRFRVRVTNAGGSATSNEALLTVSANQAPVAAITLPVAGTTYGGGQTITFAGNGNDSEDGPLPGAAFTWQVDLHHDAHVHPFLPATSGVTGGTFVIPTTGHTETTVWYRIHLTVTDSDGATSTVFRDVAPRVVQLTLTTVPAGRPLFLDSQPVTTPLVAPSVEGVVRTIEARDHGDADGAFTFTGWADGGAARRDIATPAVDTTYTATFERVTAAPAVPTGFALAANGATLTATWNPVGNARSYRLEVGTASGLANLLNLDVGNTSFVQGVVPQGTYFARVRAVQTSGTSSPSSEASAVVSTTAACVAVPPVPANYLARTGGLTAAVSWWPSAAATSYRLEVGTVAGAADVLVSDLGSATSFTATAPAGTYFTRVRAVNACGASAPSIEAPVVLTCAADAVVPTGLSATSAGGVATLAWQPPLGATGYRLLVGTTAGVANLLDVPLPGTAPAVAVPLAGVPPGTYYVRVAATSACGIGLPSNEVTLTVP